MTGPTQCQCISVSYLERSYRDSDRVGKNLKWWIEDSSVRNFAIKIRLTACMTCHQRYDAGNLPDKRKRKEDCGCCAQMAYNMCPWTTSAAYHQETSTCTHTRTLSHRSVKYLVGAKHIIALHYNNNFPTKRALNRTDWEHRRIFILAGLTFKTLYGLQRFLRCCVCHRIIHHCSTI